jgi:hypothetical protein
VTPDVLTILAALVIIVAVPVNWYATVRLIGLSRANRDVRVLHERAIMSFSVSCVVTIFGLIFVNNGLTTPLLDLDGTKALTRLAALGLTFPALYWIWIYR